ncbi:MAG: hypothetical protein ACHQ6T_01700 [Myxococcota bacterium]
MSADLLVEQQFDSNIFNKTTDTQSSPITIVRPALRVENTGSLGHARFDGWLSSHTYWEESTLDGVDRGISGDIDREILPRVSLFANGSYQRVAAHDAIRGADVVTISGGAPGAPGEPVVTPGQLIEGAVPNVDIAQGEFGTRYLLTPSSKLTLSGGPYSVDYLGTEVGRPDLRNRDGWFSTAVLDHSLSALDSISVQVGGNSTNFEDLIIAPVPVLNPFDPHEVDLNTGKTTSDQLNLTIGWDRAWTELWKTHIDVGGRRLHTKTVDALEPVTRVAPGFGFGGDAQPYTDYVPTNSSDVGPGVIGEMTLERILPYGSVGLSYSRETRTTSSLAASNVNVDTVSLSYLQHLSARATLTLFGSYEHYVSANNSAGFAPATYVTNSFNPITGPDYTCSSGTLTTTGSGANKAGQCSLGASSTLKSDSWIAVAHFDWQLYRRLATFVTVRYVDRSGDVKLFGNDYNKFNVGIGFRYDYGLYY